MSEGTLVGRHVVVTGAARGIGLEIAYRASVATGPTSPCSISTGKGSNRPSPLAA